MSGRFPWLWGQRGKGVKSVTISELCKGIAGHNWGYFYKNLVGALMDKPVIVASTNRHSPRFPSSDDNVMKIID